MFPIKVIIYGVVGAVIDQGLKTRPNFTILLALVGYLIWVRATRSRLMDDGTFGIAPFGGEYSWSLTTNKSRVYIGLTLATLVVNLFVLGILALVAASVGPPNIWKEILVGPAFVLWFVILSVAALSFFYAACRRFERPTQKRPMDVQPRTMDVQPRTTTISGESEPEFHFSDGSTAKDYPDPTSMDSNGRDST
jgi:hypothetical protein